MTVPRDDKDDTERDAGGKDGSAGRVAEQLDALQGRWESVRRNIAEVSHAGAEAWRAVEPDARRLIAEMRAILDSAGDRFREVRGEASGPAGTDVRPAPLAPPAAPAAPAPPAPGTSSDAPPRA